VPAVDETDPQDILAESVDFSEDSMTVRLDDGRALSVPLAWYPRLLNGTKAEREKYELIGGGEVEVDPVPGPSREHQPLLRPPLARPSGLSDR